jgi:predicted nucleic acid-binding protein
MGHPELTARAAIHMAIMREHGIENVLNFDRHFDVLPGINRLH